MRYICYLKFWHPKDKLTWSGRQILYLDRKEEACFVCEDIVLEFLSAGWELKKRHIIEPQGGFCEKAQ